MKIKREITLNYIESLYDELENSENNSLDIIIPFKGLRERNFSSLPSFIQFYSTWLRSDKKRHLVLDIENENLEDEGNVASIYSFITTSLYWDSDIKDIEGNSIKKILLKRLNTKFNKNQKNILTNKGAELLLACFDFDKNLENRGLLNAMYDHNGNLKDDDYFRYNLVPEIILEIGRKFSMPLIKGAFKAEDIRNIGQILYELFKNTHEWGRWENSGLRLTPNIRAIYCVLHKSTQQNFLSYAGSNGLQKYLSNDSFKPNSVNEIYFLEISVFDSGIGFIRSFLGDDYKQNEIEIGQQVIIVKDCLTKYFTTDKSLHTKHKGKGLDRVLQALDKKGFLRIRTENVCVYRDLVKDDYSKIDSNNIDLFDWELESSKDFKKYKRTEGATLSLIYPVNSIYNE
jgi:hypothetical protein